MQSRLSLSSVSALHSGPSSPNSSSSLHLDFPDFNALHCHSFSLPVSCKRKHWTFPSSQKARRGARAVATCMVATTAKREADVQSYAKVFSKEKLTIAVRDEYTIEGITRLSPLLSDLFKGIKHIGIIAWGSQACTYTLNLCESLAKAKFDIVVKAHWLGDLFGFSKDEKPWIVPWTFFTVVQVIFLWFITFWLVGSWIIPVLAHYFGCSKATLSFRGQAVYSLVTDIAEGTVGISILHRCLVQFHPLPKDWFPISWQGRWYIDVLFGCLMFPLVNMLSEINLDLLPLQHPVVSCEQSILKQDPVASMLYAVIVSVCCPIWEEVIFRGFLLPSLTRYLPMWGSIIVSAVVFGLAHFSMQRMLPLSFLGLMMGILFVRTRNLLPCIFLHSLWNAFVFVAMFR